DALRVGQVDDPHALFAQPVVPTLEVHRIAHHHRADAELPDQAAAVPARGQGADHDGVAVGALAAGLAEGVGLAVHGGVGLLHAAVAAAAKQGAVGGEQGGADRDAALGQAGTGFLEGDGEQGAVIGAGIHGGGSVRGESTAYAPAGACAAPARGRGVTPAMAAAAIITPSANPPTTAAPPTSA